MILPVEKAIKRCMDGQCRGKVLFKHGDYEEIEVWRVVESPRRHYWFVSMEAAQEWADKRGITLEPR